MEYVLKTNLLKKCYGNYKALNGLSMSVPKGAIYARQKKVLFHHIRRFLPVENIFDNFYQRMPKC